MPIDASIPLQVRKPNFMGPGDILSLRDLAQRLQMGQIDLQNARQAQTDDQQLRQLFSGAQVDPQTGGPSLGTIQQATAISPTTGMKLSGQRQAQQLQLSQIGSNQATMATHQLAVNTKKTELFQKAKEDAINAYDGVIKSGGSQGTAQKAFSDTLHSTMQEYDKSGLLAGLYNNEEEHKNLLNPQVTYEMAKAQVVPLKDLQHQAETEAKLKLEASKDAESAAARKRQLDIDEKRLREEARHHRTTEEQSAPQPMDSDTLEMDAHRYLMDGTLPPNMGRGAQGAQQATKIRNRAAELAKQAGMEPDEIRTAQLMNKGQVGAILQLSKARAQILQFEKTAEKNADLALDASKKVWRTDSPWVNQPLNIVRNKAAGDADFSVFNAANETFISEYAKVMGGGYGASSTTEGAQNRAHQLLNAAMSPKQYEAVVAQLKKEMKNREGALNDQVDEERMRLRGQSKPAQSQAPQGPQELPKDPSQMQAGSTYLTPHGPAKFVRMNGTRAVFEAPDDPGGPPMTGGPLEKNAAPIQGEQLPEPKSKEERDKLAPGTKYRAPDGAIRIRKP